MFQRANQIRRVLASLLVLLVIVLLLLAAVPTAAVTYSTLVAQHSGKCLQVADGSYESGAGVVQWTCDGGSHQYWRLRPVGGDYEIVARHSDKCLDVPGGDPSNGVALVQWDCHGGDNQLWRLVPAGEGYQIVSQLSGRCLDIAWGELSDGAALIQWDCHGGDNQVFANDWFAEDYRAFLPVTSKPGCSPVADNPRWQMLVVVYDTTDFAFVDGSGVERHLVAGLTEAEQKKVAFAATRFARYDIPALNSCNMQPDLTIRHPAQPLTHLVPGGCDDYVPSPEDTAADRDPAFDSVIVVWDGSGVDALSGEALSVGGCAYAWGMGTGQTYDAIHVDFISPRDRNVFKHEWGHSIIFYYDAAGTAPDPPVDNHINDTDNRYVNCLTGEPYILVDETDDNLIPNSIYHNHSGFTHDYYSGLTATAEQPTRCLGIPPAAWASGGPVSGPGGEVRSGGPETIGEAVR